VQAQAAEQAAQLQAQSQQKALDFQKQVWGQQLANQAPFLRAGQGAVTQLASLMRPGGALTKPWTQPWTPPTGLTQANDPGYQARLALGEQALQRSAAAQGNLLSGGTLRDVNTFAQDYASNEYQNVYNRSLQNYMTGYNVFQNNQANLYNRLAGLAGTGQTTAGQLGAAGTSMAGLTGQTLLGGAQSIGQAMQNAAAARASGYIGGANALGGMFSGIGQAASAIPLYQLLQGQQASAGGANYNNPGYWMNYANMPGTTGTGYAAGIPSSGGIPNLPTDISGGYAAMPAGLSPSTFG
jgi:hypothetical protein